MCYVSYQIEIRVLSLLSFVLLLLLFSHSALFDYLWPHGLQHARLPCLSQSPRACSNSRPLCQVCNLTISSSVIPFSSCSQPFSASGSFPVSQLFASSGQSIEASVSASALPKHIKGWFSLGLTCCTPCCPRDPQESSQPHNSKTSILQCSVFFTVQFSHSSMTTRRTCQVSDSVPP